VRRGVFSVPPLPPSEAHRLEPVTLWNLWPTALPLACLLLADGGHVLALAALQASCPPFPPAGPVLADVAALARTMGREPRQVEAEVFAVRARAWRERGQFVSHEDAVRAHGIGCAFADVGMGREWPEDAA
jgi:hypothetical protein